MHATPGFFVLLVEMGFPVAQAGLEPLTLGGPPALASQSAGIIGMSHCAWPVLYFCFEEMWFRRVAQVGLKFLGSSGQSAPASQSVGNTGVCHYAQPWPTF